MSVTPQTSEIQAALASLTSKDADVEKYWKGKPNEWVRHLPSKTIGGVGEALAQLVLGGEVIKSNRHGYDLKLGEKSIEVKLSTRSFSKTNGLTWAQIRPAESNTHVCLIAVYPETARMFLLPKNELPHLYSQHGRGGGDGKTTQIKIFDADKLPEWLTRFEILNRQSPVL